MLRTISFSRLIVNETNIPNSVNEKPFSAYGTAFVNEVKKKDEVSFSSWSKLRRLEESSLPGRSAPPISSRRRLKRDFMLPGRAMASVLR